MRRFFWDFFGPHGEGTARHFHKHLDEFLVREKIEGCTTGVVGNDMHFAAYCDTPDEHRDVIQRALRPKRFEDS